MFYPIPSRHDPLIRPQSAGTEEEQTDPEVGAPPHRHIPGIVLRRSRRLVFPRQGGAAPPKEGTDV